MWVLAPGSTAGEYFSLWHECRQRTQAARICFLSPLIGGCKQAEEEEDDEHKDADTEDDEEEQEDNDDEEEDDDDDKELYWSHSKWTTLHCIALYLESRCTVMLLMSLPARETTSRSSTVITVCCLSLDDTWTHQSHFSQVLFYRKSVSLFRSLRVKVFAYCSTLVKIARNTVTTWQQHCYYPGCCWLVQLSNLSDWRVLGWNLKDFHHLCSCFVGSIVTQYH